MLSLIDKIAVGTTQFASHLANPQARARSAEEELAATLKLAVQAGLTTLDTDVAHCDIDALIGRLAPREHPLRVMVRTRSGTEGATAVEASARASLRRLGLARGYAVIVGSGEDLLGPEGPGLWRRLRALQEEGLFEHVGVSLRVEDAPVAMARRFRPDIVQAPVSVLDQRLVANGDLARLADLGVEVQLRSIFQHGLLFTPRHGLPAGLADAGPRLSRARRYIAEAGADPLQAALAFALSRPEAKRVIVGVGSAAELRAILAASSAPLPNLDWDQLAMDPPTARHVGLWAAA
jgi:aryl-alcohol dehydrogenase-like predicted oxidoreductase